MNSSNMICWCIFRVTISVFKNDNFIYNYNVVDGLELKLKSGNPLPTPLHLFYYLFMEPMS